MHHPPLMNSSWPFATSFLTSAFMLSFCSFHQRDMNDIST